MVKGTKQWVLLIAGALVLAFCSPKDDERALRELVEKAARFAEQHDIGGLMDLTTEDFHALPGDLDRRGTKRILFMAFRHYGELKVVYPQPDVDLSPGEEGASVSVPFLMIKKGESLPQVKELYNDPRRWIEKVGETADLYHLKLKVLKVDDEWLVRRIYLARFAGMRMRDAP